MSASCGTISAQAIELYKMIRYLEIIFFRKPLFCLPEQLDLLINEIRIVHDLPASGTYEMVMMVRLFRTLGQFISGTTISYIQLEDKSHVRQDFQGPVDGGQPYVWMRCVQLHIDVFRAYMLVSIGEEFKNSFPCDSHPISAAMELPMPSFSILAAFLHCNSQYMIMITISNYTASAYIVKISISFIQKQIPNQTRIWI